MFMGNKRKNWVRKYIILHPDSIEIFRYKSIAYNQNSEKFWLSIFIEP